MNGVCQAGTQPCAQSDQCDEDNDQCISGGCQADFDCDGAPDDLDNCPGIANFSDEGTCVMEIGGVLMGTGVGCTSDDMCELDQICQQNQEDTFPSEPNGVGDACECYSDANCDSKIDIADLIALRSEFFLSDCDIDPCIADFNSDKQVDLSDLIILKLQFLRNNCPPCF